MFIISIIIAPHTHTPHKHAHAHAHHTQTHTHAHTHLHTHAYSTPSPFSGELAQDIFDRYLCYAAPEPVYIDSELLEDITYNLYYNQWAHR